MKDNLIFLFGSGISINAAMPSTTDITEIVMSAKGVKRETSRPRYSIRKEINPLLDYNFIPEIVELIRIVWTKLKTYYYDHYFYNRKTINYEDIYYIINEIYLDIFGEIQNPAIEPFIVGLRDQILPKLFRDNSEIEHDLSFNDLINETLEYIKAIVRDMLNKDQNENLSYLNFIKSFNENENYHQKSIFTLNHDLILERYFSENKIEIESGFERADKNGRRFWNPLLFENNVEEKIEFYKLHGSINWYRFQNGKNGWFDEEICCSEVPDRDAHELPSDNLILVGSYNKLSEYAGGIFTFLLGQFNYKLLKCNKLVISGYGFQDSGINKQISNWVYTNPSNRIVLIDPNIEEVKKHKSLFSSHYGEWEKVGVLKVIRKGIEDALYNEILENLEIKD